MWLEEETPIRKQDLVLEKPFVNAPGFLGFYPNPSLMPFLPHLGAFITNSISLRPRQPAKNRNYITFPGGFLLHTGLHNPGIHRAVARFRKRWAHASLPVIVHLLVEDPASLAGMVRKLEGLENIIAVELGLPPGCEAGMLQEIVSAAAGELPTVVCLAPEQVPTLLETLVNLHPAAVHLVSPRGSLPTSDGDLVTGRLYGPTIFPLMLHAVQKLLEVELRVIADGGVTTRRQADALLGAGVMAVGLGSVLWQIDQTSIFATS